MSEEDVQILTSDRVQTFLKENLEADPAQLALSHKKNDFPIALVSTQLKYLQKSKKKLPTYYNQACIIPPLAYEQASSEATAAMKVYEGHHCLDLTMGLGVDTLSFARQFEQVTAVEIDPVKRSVAQFNFQRLGISNVSIEASDAQSFLAAYQGPPFDLIYIDPARRNDKGVKVHDLAAYSPNVLHLKDLLFRHGKTIVVKVSPLYDVDAAKQQFPDLAALHIHSLQFECKELLLVWTPHQGSPELPLIIKVQNGAKPATFRFVGSNSLFLPQPIPEPTYILEPDVAFYKARVLPTLFQRYFPELSGTLTDPIGYFFATEIPPASFPGKVFEVLASYPFKRKLIRHDLKQRDIRHAHITKRVFPMTVADIHRQIGTRASGKHMLIATTVGEAHRMYLTLRIR